MELLGTHPHFLDPIGFMSTRDAGHKCKKGKKKTFQSDLLTRVSHYFGRTSSVEAGFLSFYSLYSFYSVDSIVFITCNYISVA